MRIGIIGAGNIGGTLAYLLGRTGNEVAIANSRGPDTLRELEKDLGDQVQATTVTEAAKFGDVVVVAIPFGRYRDLPATELSGKTVVDAGNYYPERDGHIADLDDGGITSSELVQRHLAGAHVVKAFNAMRAGHLRDFGHEGGANQRYGIPVSGDDAKAKQAVFELIEQLGFEPVDAGHLAEGGRKHQPGTEVYLADLWANDLRARIGVEPA